MSFAKIRQEGRCRLCFHDGTTFPITRHHLIQRRDQGPHDPRNCVPLCIRCHVIVDGGHGPERRRARAKLRTNLKMSEINYLLDRRGVLWLDDNYPRPELLGREMETRKQQRRRKMKKRRERYVHLDGCHTLYGCVVGCPVFDSRWRTTQTKGYTG